MRPKKVRGGTETVLVLEDDVSVRHISVRMLRALGYKVIEAANSADAQDLLAQNGERKVDLLLTDIVMPQIDGFGLYEEIRKIDAKVKVCFITAFEVNYQALRAVFGGWTADLAVRAIASNNSPTSLIKA